MRVALSWLTEVLQRANAGWSATPEEIDAGFVRVGFEVEGEPEPLPRITGPLVIGRVRSIEELEGFKKPIRFCLVDVGADEPQQIVCGARNFGEGDLVVVALPGTVLPGDFRIGARTTYGRPSEGMICSASELGLGADHSGILVLRPGTAEPGESGQEVLGLDDTVIELNITPDRGYAFSVRGLTRELAAGFGLDFADPADPALRSGLAADGPARGLEVAADAGVRRFALREVTGIDPAARTPLWMVRRLLTSGVRPISPAVDVTNYVMLELGHPMHAFDAATVRGDLRVRRAREGEQLVTLDGATRPLDVEDVVICDDRGPISLAGVMGGRDTEVSDATTDVLLEAAVWAPLNVFRTIRRHKLPSEAGKRYERGVDPAASVIALDRAAMLLAEITGGTVTSVLTEYGGADTAPSVTLDAAYPGRVAGVVHAEGTAARRLRQVGCAVEESDGGATLTVTPPTWRPDLTQPADLVEEVLRLEGLEDIPSVVPAAPAGRGLTAGQRARRAVGRALAAAGHVEVLTSPFVDPSVFDALGLAADDPRRHTMSVLNPLESDRAALATTLLPSLVDIARRNLARGSRDLALYSVAQVAVRTPHTRAVEMLTVDRRPTEDEMRVLADSLPDQPVHVAMLYCGRREPAGHWGPGRPVDAHDAIDAAVGVGRAAGVRLRPVAAETAPWHPGRCAALEADGVVVGHAGELHPAVCERLGLPPRTCAAELDLTAVGAPEVLPAPVISPYPPVHQDVALIVDGSVPAAAVADALRDGGGELLEDVRLFDVYTGEQVGAGRRSLAYALTFRADDRTLTEDEASRARGLAVEEAIRRVGAEQRA